MHPVTVETLGRAFGLYRRTALSRSALVLVIANLIPLVGVVFFGWSLLTILVLYWLENGIVGFWNVPKIALAQGSMVPTLPDLPEAAARIATANPAQAAALQAAWERERAARAAAAANAVANRFNAVGRSGLALFFILHYGVFWVVHGIFVFALPAFGNGFGSIGPDAISCLPTNPPIPGYEICESASPFGDVVWSSVAIAGLALFISHGASFFLNYIGRGEYLTASPGGQMAGAYGRVVVLHLTIIFGSMIVAFLGAPIGALLVLVALKIAFDLGLHLRERSRADARIPADTTFGQLVRGNLDPTATSAAPPSPPA